MPHDAVILFAHGARDAAWARPFEQVRSLMRAQQPDLAVELAFLEFMTPDLATAGDTLAAAGHVAVRIVPVFLGAGGHVRRDLPVRVQALREAHPQVQWTLTPAVGESPAVLAAIADMAATAAPLVGDAQPSGPAA